MTKKVEFERLLAQERVLVEAMESLWSELERSGIRKSDVAERLGVSKAYVTQALNGGRNLTLRTLADLAWALDARVNVSLSPNALDESRPFVTTASTTSLVDQSVPETAMPNVVGAKTGTAFAQAA